MAISQKNIFERASEILKNMEKINKVSKSASCDFSNSFSEHNGDSLISHFMSPVLEVQHFLGHSKNDNWILHHLCWHIRLFYKEGEIE